MQVRDNHVLIIHLIGQTLPQPVQATIFTMYQKGVTWTFADPACPV